MSVARSETRSDQIVAQIRETNAHYAPSKCPWHFNRNCVFLSNNFDRRRFHCLYACNSLQWKSISVTGSCELPEQFYEMRELEKKIGSEYVLPYADRLRVRSGYVVALFELEIGLYGSDVLDATNIAETFYTMMVFAVAACRRLGGHPPVFKSMSFLYTKRHPVLADVGSANVDKRERIGNREYYNKKKWSRYLKKRTAQEISKYLKLIRPDFFKKSKPKRSVCVLSENFAFPRDVHEMFCENKKTKIVEMLTKFKRAAGNEKIGAIVSKWLEEVDEENS